MGKQARLSPFGPDRQVPSSVSPPRVTAHSAPSSIPLQAATASGGGP